MQPRKSQLILFALALGIILAAMYPLFRVPSLHGYAGDFVPATGEVLLSTKSPSRKKPSPILWLNLETGKIHSGRPAALQPGLATAITNRVRLSAVL